MSNPTYKTCYIVASPSKEADLIDALTEEHAFKKARYIKLGKHEPDSPRRKTIDAVLMLGQSMTHNTLKQILPADVVIYKTPPHVPPSGDTWTTQKMIEFVMRGDQPIEEYQQLGATGAAYNPHEQILFTHGQPPKQGKRTDIDDMLEEAMTGTTKKELKMRFLKISNKSLSEARDRYLMTQSRNSCEVYVRFGPTATSKSWHAINSDWADVPFYSKTCSKDNKWFCDYDGERKVILDEFRGAKHKFEMESLNSWMQDHNICRVEPKYGGCALIADKFVITSPMHPCKWFPDNVDNEDDNIDQLLRRITVIYKHMSTQPPAGTLYTTSHWANETAYITETRRLPAETNAAWCTRVRAMPDAL